MAGKRSEHSFSRQDPDVYYDSYLKHLKSPLLTLIGFYKGYYHDFILSAIFFTIKNSPVWILPIVISDIINALTAGNAGAGHTILLESAVFIGLIAMNFPVNWLCVHFKSIPIRSVEAGLRSAIIHKIQEISIPYEKNFETGRLQSKVIRDVENVEEVSTQLFTSLMTVAINIVVALAVTVSRSLTVFLFFLATVPVAAIVAGLFRNPIANRNRSFRKEVEDTGVKVSEMVELEPIVRAHALEGTETEKMDRQVRKIADEGYRLDILQENFNALSWCVLQIFQVICLAFTAFLVLHGKMAIGDIVLYQSYFTNIVAQATLLLSLIPTISKGLESVNSIMEVMNIWDVEEDASAEPVPALHGEYEFRDVSYHYPKAERDIIKHFDLHVDPGTSVAFVGESGSGKSTVISMIIGFGLPTGGTLSVDGRDIRNISMHDYRKHIAVVPQESILFSGTIRENILYGMDHVDEAEFDRVVRESGLLQVVEKMPRGFDTMVGERGDRLSGGQKQRISIARALIRKPDVLILDEATSALDNLSEKQVTGAFDHLSTKCTKFIVAHRLKTIRNADVIVALKNGTVVETGTYRELMEKKGYFYKMEMEPDEQE